MTDLSLDSVFVVCVAGALAPLLLGLSPRLRLPAVVLEIVAGIILGPSVLGWIEIDAPVQVLSMMGCRSCCSCPAWRSMCGGSAEGCCA
ncbi:MAG: cation:proton antiporter [Actinomycetota bacterium]|nr:cation:proton antiporter [Actinomycetota bacterium]